MLTAYQCSTVAYMTEYGELLCPDCFDRGDTLAQPVIEYSLDEEQTARAEGWLDWDYLDEIETRNGVQYRQGPDGLWHSEGCACEPSLEDDEGHELAEAYVSDGCSEVLDEEEEDGES